MFKAINRETSEAVTILDSKWLHQLDDLRSLDRQDILICQGCKQPVRVRAGTSKRWHFAHKHLQNCTYGLESPTLLQLRAVLYQWLVTKFGDKVIVEKMLDSRYFPRPVDCWIERAAGNLAYWLIDSGIRPPVREDLKVGFEHVGANVHWVFLASMLNEPEDHPNRIKLTPTERKFAHPSVYDEPVLGSRFMVGNSLHYLDPDTEILTTFRGLRLIHEPQLFEGHKERHDLSQILVSPKTGEFVHPGEYEQLRHYQQEQRRLEEEQKALEQRMQEQRRLEAEQRAREQQHFFRQRTESDSVSESKGVSVPLTGLTPKGNTQPRYAGSLKKEEATCVICGNKTRDWWYFDGATKTCECRTCSRKGK